MTFLSSPLFRLFCMLLLCGGAVFLFRWLSRTLPRKLPETGTNFLLLLLLGCTPLFAGLLLDGLITAIPAVSLLLPLFSAAALLGWTILSRHWRKKVGSTLRVLLLQNLIPALVFLLVTVQLLGAQRFWAGFPGFLSQEFFLPVIHLGFWMTGALSTHSFPAYCVAFALLPTLSFVGCLWGGERTVPRLLPYLTRRIGLVLLALWFLGMSLLTVGTAQYVLDDLTERGYTFAEHAGGAGRLEEYFPDLEEEQNKNFRPEPGGMDYCMLSTITLSSLGINTPSISYYDEDTFFSGIFRQGTWTPLNTALLFVDTAGNILHQNGDFIYFYYLNEERWAAQEDGIDSYAWVDLSDREDGRYALLRESYAGRHSLFDWDTMRMTGYFDGTRFEPLSMALADYFDYHEGLESLAVDHSGPISNSTSEVTMAQLDAMGLIEWEACYDHTAQAPAGKELVTIYGRYPEMMLYDSEPVRYQGQVYDDLVTLLGEMGYYRDKGSLTFHQSKSQISLWNTVVFGCRSYRDFSDYDPTANQPWPDAEITLMTAVQASPLLIAAKYLRNIYLITAALVLVAFLWLRSLVKNHISTPLQTVNSHIAEGWSHLPDYTHTPPELQETRELVGHYRSTQQQLYGHKNEISRLTAALHYAETAEDNRRQMTSHIAHELKTPLAVIHSYTEGLQEHIAEEKRDKYLEVILSETERMDAMVLEMLDLSRLEAGRVKLARDEFSLLKLCRSVFDKLSLALQAKDLRVTYTCHCSDTVTADEGRIRQVMENFATNAIKHTPAGGEIRIRVTADRSGHTFAMKNDGDPLPADVLDKVWDSFWRQDESRSSPGTGLGLAICKGIITLHGGTCEARNTVRGVEFRFRI